MLTTITLVQSILGSRKISSLIGHKEDLWFDAKSGHYDLDSPIGRFELAKDASAFANAEGGFVIVGLQTKPVAQEKTEEVSGLDLLTEPAFNQAKVAGILREYLHPSVQDLSVSWVQDIAGGGKGVGVIFVPEQPLDRRFVLIKHVVDGSVAVKQFVFGFARRHDSHNIPLTIEQLHNMFQNGRTTGSERLNRIEGKIDHLTRLSESSNERSAPESKESSEKKMTERLNDLLGEVKNGD